jgi:hypothetical protein
MISRRNFLLSIGAAAATRPLAALDDVAAGSPLPTVTIYKSATCGCCTKWVDHLSASGFKVSAFDTEDMNRIKRSFGVPPALESCHTAKVGAYVLEGHIPADLVKKLLASKSSSIRGLAVPGMPQGSPGMETGQKDAYDVIAWDRTGATSVFARR